MTTAALARDITRLSAHLKDEYLSRELARLGLTLTEALTQGYEQVTAMDSCRGTGVIVTHPDTLAAPYSVTVALCPCYRLARVHEAAVCEVGDRGIPY